MPLTHANATPAERITLPLYPAAYITLGLLFILQAPTRTQGPTFDAARTIGDPVLPGIGGIATWGIVFITIGAVEATALTLHLSHRIYINALIVGAGLAAFWAGAALASAWASPDASYTSVVWIIVPAAAQAASARMLARHSVRP